MQQSIIIGKQENNRLKQEKEELHQSNQSTQEDYNMQLETKTRNLNEQITLLQADNENWKKKKQAYENDKEKTK